MHFEFDRTKSASNAEKHGINFAEAQALWADPDLLEIPAQAVDEPRFISIGVIDGKHWTAITTTRAHNIRIISVRRSRKAEVKLYES